MRLLYSVVFVLVVITAFFVGLLRYESSNTVVNVGNDSVLDEYRGYAVRDITVGNKQYHVFVSDTPELRARGLSGKTALPSGYGMEFVFETPGAYGFWMNEMRFPVDIFWVKDGVIVDMWQNAGIPGEHIPSYTPSSVADSVYEFAAGFAKENGLRVGERMY